MNQRHFGFVANRNCCIAEMAQILNLNVRYRSLSRRLNKILGWPLRAQNGSALLKLLAHAVMKPRLIFSCNVLRKAVVRVKRSEFLGVDVDLRKKSLFTGTQFLVLSETSGQLIIASSAWWRLDRRTLCHRVHIDVSTRHFDHVI